MRLLVAAAGFIYWALHVIRAVQEKDWSVLIRTDVLLFSGSVMAVATYGLWFGAYGTFFTVLISIFRGR